MSEMIPNWQLRRDNSSPALYTMPAYNDTTTERIKALEVMVENLNDTVTRLTLEMAKGR